ncbi:class I SAM-dependent methyltransferase [Jiangella rhizosphaerae]|uniref:Class I SAM-dependent methyltransferase n=1 Tax=Jiangella rhizosphaerae TaxID=2293569 RepID=A0A418KU31_9ACTN|nr:class I SAM-dependent methyltransferase [Jiangella rhizosphaerae]RIQ31059.1 class I SAM-dependent methyltransferase [Jiangella rhizosphaerae]
MADRELRTIFDEDAELYTRARPGYPDAIFAALGELAGLGPGARVVEIGPGTGQATLPLVARGAHVVAVELGANLAAALRQRTAGHPVEVVESTFEQWAAPPASAELVTSFTAWHWLHPAVRAGRVAAVLRPGGALATVTTEHVLGGTADFFADVQECYERWDPATPPGLRLQPADAIAPFADEIDDSPLFRPAVRRRYRTDVTYDAQGYLDLLSTYSGHRALRPDRRRGLFDCVRGLIENRYGGTVTKAYLYELRVARLSAPAGDDDARR